MWAARLKNRVREFRDIHGIGQNVLAAGCDIPRGTLARIEMGEFLPSGAMLLRLCVFFHCELGALFYIEWNPDAFKPEFPVIEEDIACE